jgi:hypothetical protein
MLAVLIACGALQAEPITTIPDSAYVMIKVNNLEKTSAKIGKLCEQWGIAALQPQAADPLGALLAATQIKQGVQKDGELGIAVMPGMGQPTFIAMVPVSDYAAFVGNFQGAKAEEAVTSFILPENGMQAFVAKQGGYAVISMDRGLLETKPASSALPAITGKEMSGRDIAVYVNFRSFRQEAVGGAEFIKSMVIEQVAQKAVEAGGDRKALAPVIRAAIGQYVTGFVRMVSDTRALTYGLSLSDEGVQMTYVAEFEPGSYLAKLSAGFKGSSDELMTGLPAGKYLMVGGMAFDKEPLLQIINDAAQPVAAEAAKIGATGKPILDFIEATKLYAKSTNRYAFAMSAADGKVGEAPLMSAVAVMEGDAANIQASQRTMMKTQGQLMEVLDAETHGTTIKSEVKPAAATIGGVSFDVFSQTIETAQPDTPEVAMQKLFYGPSGIQGKVGVVNPKLVVFGQSVDDATLAGVLDAAKSGSKDAITAPVKSVAGHLPKTRLMEAYISLENGAAAASKLAEAITGNPLPIQIPEGQPPVGMSLSAQPGAMQMDVYLPSVVLQNMIGAGMQAYMAQMMLNDDGL